MQITTSFHYLYAVVFLDSQRKLQVRRFEHATSQKHLYTHRDCTLQVVKEDEQIILYKQWGEKGFYTI